MTTKIPSNSIVFLFLFTEISTTTQYLLEENTWRFEFMWVCRSAFRCQSLHRSYRECEKKWILKWTNGFSVFCIFSPVFTSNFIFKDQKLFFSNPSPKRPRIRCNQIVYKIKTDIQVFPPRILLTMIHLNVGIGFCMAIIDKLPLCVGSRNVAHSVGEFLSFRFPPSCWGISTFLQHPSTPSAP